MGNMKRRMAMLAAVAVMSTTALTGCGQKIDQGATVVTVGEDKVTMGVANFFARHQQAIAQAQYGAMFGEDFWGMSLAQGGNTMEQDVKESILTTLEQLYVLEDHMADYKVELTEEEKSKVQKIAKEFLSANKEDVLEKVSGTEETVVRVLELMTIQAKMREAMIADVDTKVSDEEALQKSMDYVFFSFSKKDADGKAVEMTDAEKEEVKKKAEAFSEKAATAENLEKLAKEQELTVSTLKFDSKKTTPSEEFVKAADALKEGEVTGAIKGETGYYVGKVTSLFDKEATEEKKASIVRERQDKKYQEVLEGFMKDAKIDVNEEEWNKISFKNVKVFMKQKAENK